MYLLDGKDMAVNISYGISFSISSAAPAPHSQLPLQISIEISMNAAHMCKHSIRKLNVDVNMFIITHRSLTRIFSGWLILGLLKSVSCT